MATMMTIGMLATGSKKDEFWTPENEMSLVEKIKSFPALYNSSHEDWKNKSHRDDIWEMIATELETSVENCRKRYKGLRDKAVRDYRTGKESKDPATKAMEFVLPLARIRKDARSSDANESNENEAEDEEDTEPYLPITTPPTYTNKYSNKNNKGPMIIGTRTLKQENSPISSTLPIYEIDESSGGSTSGGDYYTYNSNSLNYSNQLQHRAGIITPATNNSTGRTVIMKRSMDFSGSNNNNHRASSNNKKSRLDSNGINGSTITPTSIAGTTAAGTFVKPEYSPNFYFGQYISAAIAKLPNEQVRSSIRQKIQDMLFREQVKYALDKPDDGSSKDVVVYNSKLGHAQILEIEKE